MIAHTKDTIGIVSLGCPRNLVDSESMLGRLARKGHPIVDIDKADVGIINTCAFIEDAKKESIDAILDLVELKKEGRLKKVVVCGCLVQRYRKELQTQLPEVDAFIGTPSLNHEERRFPLTPKHFAYLKICESCIHACSYCVIPAIKGKFASLDMESIGRKADIFNAQGISELTIIGQDITGYGLDLYRSRALPALLKDIIKRTPRIHWLRLLYLYPGPVVEDVLKIIRDSGRVCQYIDLPIQHINGRVLEAMRRQTTKKEIRRLIDKIRKTLPHAAIRTSVIVGFPSETTKQFRELVDFIKETRFERLGAFIYSREDRTSASRLKGQIPQAVKNERLNTIMLAQQEVSRAFNMRFAGKTVEVLIDEIQEGAQGQYLGRTEYDAPEVDGTVFVSSQRTLTPGEFVRVEITDTLEYDLVGRKE
jgi:ribosomal protein S12 methylthiotransferase